MRGRFLFEPIVKTRDYHIRPPTSPVNRLRIRHLASMTAFSVRPSPSATRPAETHRRRSGGKLPRTLRAAQDRPDALADDRVFARFHHPDADREPGGRTRRHLDA